MTPAAARELSQRELAAALAGGRGFDPRGIAGWVYRGTSLGLPGWIERLTWTKFAKAFHREVGGHVRGWNVRIEQDGLDRAWRPRMRHGRAITFGRFTVVEAATGIVLDYHVERGPMQVLRDPLVALDDRADTLLGRSFVQLGPASIPTPSYFLLEHDERVVDPLPALG